MNNGASTAVLVTDLLREDGPAADVAADYVATRCSLCARYDREEFRFDDSGYTCTPCGRDAVIR